MFFRFFYMIDRKTDKIGTKHFFENALVRYSPVPCDEAAIVLDNHSANHSYLVTGFCKEKQLELKFTPPYSSVLNPGKFSIVANKFSLVERVWAVLKR